MTPTRSEPDSAARVDPAASADIRWLQQSWPRYDWTRATLTHACFHNVANLAPNVVARISRHGNQVSRVEREHAILAALAGVALPFAVPRNRSAVIARGGYAGMLTTYVPGVHRSDVAWADAAGSISRVLAALAQADMEAVKGLLPMPRAWCGGKYWPAVVREQLVPRLPDELRSMADSVVGAVLDVERGIPPILVHGDFGPHNLLWQGDTVLGVIDFDHACVGDPGIDAACLISRFGAAAVATIVDAPTLDRAMVHRASLTLQMAAAAQLVGDEPLRDHALLNFAARARTRTLFDPGGSVPTRGS